MKSQKSRKSFIILLTFLLLIALAISASTGCKTTTQYQICKESGRGGNAFALLGQAVANSNVNENTNTNINSNKSIQIESECFKILKIEFRRNFILLECDGQFNKSCKDKIQFIESGNFQRKKKPTQ